MKRTQLAESGAGEYTICHIVGSLVLQMRAATMHDMSGRIQLLTPTSETRSMLKESH
jgi:hypothetical protein